MSVSLLTWNLAGQSLHCRHRPSQDDKSARIVSEVARLAPDILLLQESSVPAHLWRSVGYESAARPAKTHGDGITEIYRRTCSGELLRSWNVAAHWPLPFAGPKDIYDFPIAQIRFNQCNLTLVSVHLAAGAAGAQQRATQLRLLHSTFQSIPGPLIIAGDTNMRENETSEACKIVECQDAFISCGSPPHHKFTWDSFQNRFYDNGVRFKARFDRVLYRNNLTVSDFSLVKAPQPSNTFLSDHFGIFCRLTPTE